MIAHFKSNIFNLLILKFSVLSKIHISPIFSFTDLSDLAVYGVLSAIEGCDAFQDLLENTKVEPWFQRMKEACAQHKGQAIFHWFISNKSSSFLFIYQNLSYIQDWGGPKQKQKLHSLIQLLNGTSQQIIFFLLKKEEGFGKET